MMLCYVFIRLWYKNCSALENKLEDVLLSASICVRLLLFVSFLLLLFSHYVVSNSFGTPWIVACQASLSMGFPRQEYWSGLPFPSPGDLAQPAVEPRSSAWQADSLLLSEVSICVRLILFDSLLLEDSEKPPVPLLLRKV